MKEVKVPTLQELVNVCGYGKNNDTSNYIVENKFIILDVRTKEEYNESHVLGSINIPYDAINQNINLDKNKTILVYCRSGKRSSIAVNTLNKLGYKSYNIGGIINIGL